VSISACNRASGRTVLHVNRFFNQFLYLLRSLPSKELRLRRAKEEQVRFSFSSKLSLKIFFVEKRLGSATELTSGARDRLSLKTRLGYVTKNGAPRFACFRHEKANRGAPLHTAQQN